MAALGFAALLILLFGTSTTREIHTSVLIGASRDKVWEVLTDTSGYPSWNPLIRSVEGKLAVGENLSVHIDLPNGPSTTIRPHIVAFIPGKELRWKGQVLIPGIFDGEHSFRLEEDGAATRFIHHERFSGFLVGPVTSSMLDNTEEGFRRMNQALKHRCEAR
jgi:hypothetical protein